jgi:hypothetical protein
VARPEITAVLPRWIRSTRSGAEVESPGGDDCACHPCHNSRPRNHDAGSSLAQASASLPRQRAIVDAFLAASRGGEFEALLALLDPDVVLRADPAAVQTGATEAVRGAIAVANTFSGRARVARSALVNGAPGAVWAPGGRPRVVFHFRIEGGKITRIDLLADPRRLGELDLVILEPGPDRYGSRAAAAPRVRSSFRRLRRCVSRRRPGRVIS